MFRRGSSLYNQSFPLYLPPRTLSHFPLMIKSPRLLNLWLLTSFILSFSLNGSVLLFFCFVWAVCSSVRSIGLNKAALPGGGGGGECPTERPHPAGQDVPRTSSHPQANIKGTAWNVASLWTLTTVCWCWAARLVGEVHFHASIGALVIMLMKLYE